LHGGEYPVRKTDRFWLRFGRYHSEILACCPENITDRAVAVVNPVKHGLGEIHKPPQQLER
jgi:hypothetical protein